MKQKTKLFHPGARFGLWHRPLPITPLFPIIAHDLHLGYAHRHYSAPLDCLEPLPRCLMGTFTTGSDVGGVVAADLGADRRQRLRPD